MKKRMEPSSLKEIFYSALQAVSSYETVRIHCARIISFSRTADFRRLLVVGFGKAACPMAKAMEDSLGDLTGSGAVITKYGHCSDYLLKHVRVFEAGHPVPDEKGVKGTDEIVRLLRDAGDDTLVVCLISGGGSALLVSPSEGISLAEKQELTGLLLRSGADINELNAVRKHISRVKGGRLAEIACPAHVISLIISDVIGDRPDVIASGPTSADHSTYADALGVLEKYGLMDVCPESIFTHLSRGAKGLFPETPKEGDAIFERVENTVIANNRMAIEAAKKKAEEMGFHAEILSTSVSGEARQVGNMLARKAMEIRKARSTGRPVCLISGGETTVTVHGNGRGGRNMELALAFAIETEGIDGITLLSSGTDGTDGPTDAAGATVDGQTTRKARNLGLDPGTYLRHNDSYTFFKRIGGLFISGPTGTNVMDVQIVLIK
jgi:glycerate 2-kinase